MSERISPVLDLDSPHALSASILVNDSHDLPKSMIDFIDPAKDD